MTTLLCLYLLLGNSIVPTDTTYIVQGQVRDQRTKEGIPYASIVLKGTVVGTNTRSDGYFRFQVSHRFSNDTIRVSAMGYQSLSIPVSAWRNKSDAPLIFLRDTIIHLPGVVVKAPPPAVEIIQQAMANRENTYLIQPHKLEGLYRIADQENGKYVRLTETAIAVYDNDWTKKDSRIVDYLAFRQSADYRRYHWTNTKDDFARVEEVLQVDFIKRPTRATHENGFTKGFSYELTGYTTYDGQDVYVIAAHPRPETTWANYSAVFYVRQSDLAILQVDRDYDIARPNWVDTDSTVTKMTRDWISLRYREQDHKMRLQSCVILLGGDVLRKRDKTKIMGFERSQEVIFSSLQYQRTHRALKSLSDKEFQQASAQQNPQFWDSYQQAADTDLFQRVQADLATLQSQRLDTTQPLIMKVVAADSTVLFSPAQLQADFYLIRTALQESHPGLYRYMTEHTFNQLLDSVSAQLLQPQSETQFFRLISEVVAHIHCGHTGVSLSGNTRHDWKETAHVIPLQLAFRGEQVFVKSFIGNPFPSEPDIELMAIDGSPIGQIIKQLFRYVPADGYIQTAKRKTIERNFAELYAAYIHQAMDYELTLSRQGKPIRVKVKGIRLASLPMNAPIEPALRFQYLSDSSTALMTIRSFGANDRDSTGRDLPAFLATAFANLHRRQVQHLIIDLQGNTGGRDDYGALLYSYLAREPFRYYDYIGAVTNQFTFLPFTNLPPSFNDDLAKSVRLTAGGYRFLEHPCLLVQKPQSLRFTGDVYVLIDGETFSAAAEFAAIAHHRRQQTNYTQSGRTLFIGEETGGTYSGNNSGSEYTLTLPETGLRLFLPMARYELAVHENTGAGRGVLPDYNQSGYKDGALLRALLLIDERAKQQHLKN